MKRTLLLTAMVLLTSSTLFAQSEIYGRTVRWGFKLDPVFANTLSPKENGVEKAGSKFGVNYGLMADVMFADGRGAFATGVEVAHAGAKLKYVENDGHFGKGDYDIKLQYLQIPLSIKLKTNPLMESGMRAWGQFGTYMGALLGARADYTSSSSATTSKSNEKIMGATNKLNMGLLVGAGIQQPIGERTDLVVGLGLENGFTDVTTNGKWNDDGKVNLNRWALRLGVFF